MWPSLHPSDVLALSSVCQLFFAITAPKIESTFYFRWYDTSSPFDSWRGRGRGGRRGEAEGVGGGRTVSEKEKWMDYYYLFIYFYCLGFQR